MTGWAPWVLLVVAAVLILPRLLGFALRIVVAGVAVAVLVAVAGWYWRGGGAPAEVAPVVADAVTGAVEVGRRVVVDVYAYVRDLSTELPR